MTVNPRAAFAAIVFLASGCMNTEEHEEALRTSRHVHRNGEVVIEDTFRGDVKIMRRMVMRGKETVSYFRDGEIRCIESDEDGDGFRETIHIPGKRMDQFEEFRKTRDGRITPVPSGEKQKLVETIRQRMQWFDQQVERAAGSLP